MSSLSLASCVLWRMNKMDSGAKKREVGEQVIEPRDYTANGFSC
jgi:hypothetical protein